MNDRYYIKIVPHSGDTIHRFVVRRRHISAIAAFAVAALCGIAFLGAEQMQQTRNAEAHSRQERAALSTLADKAEHLRRQLEQVQRQNQEITQLIGATPQPERSPQRSSWNSAPPTLALVEDQVSVLAGASQATANESERIRMLALRVLNLRHLEEFERARLMAYIPSIDPVEGGAVVGCFCYRAFPSAEFHPGVDLAADYGTPVHAAAAGTVAFAGWDGGYGMKVDIDHGNGYHTWYAHLSRFDVGQGARVYKGEIIAESGATGFATGPHLHYQVMFQGRPIDPDPFLRGIPQTVLATLP